MTLPVLTALSTSWLRKELGVSRAAVADWRKGKIPTARATEIVEAVRALLPEQKEALRPEWAEGLEDAIAESVASRIAADPVAIRSLTETLERLDSALREVQHGDVG